MAEDNPPNDPVRESAYSTDADLGLPTGRPNGGNGAADGFPTEEIPDLRHGEDWHDDGRSKDFVEPEPISSDDYFRLTDAEKFAVPRDTRGLPIGYWSLWTQEERNRYGRENPREPNSGPPRDEPPGPGLSGGQGAAGGDAGGARIIDPHAPYTTAKLFLDGFVAAGTSTLHHHRGGFYQWNGNAYPEIGEGALRSRLYSFLDQSIKAGAKNTFLPVKPNQAAVNNLVDALRAAAYLDSNVAAPSWLNQNPRYPAGEIVACVNGLLHLPTGELFPSTPSFFSYNALDFEFDPNAQEPVQWLTFLRQLWPDDHEAINTLQDIFGYCLTADTSQQKMFLVLGPKRSGKGTIGRVLIKLLGPANCVGPTLSGLGGNFGVAPIIGKLVAIISDARLGISDHHIITERLLSITGEDSITVDRKYAQSWTGQLPTRFVILSNMLPKLADPSGALASRFIILNLTRSFYGKEDPGLTAKLLTELPGILNWAITGWHRLKSFGHFKQPQSSLDLVQQFEDLGSPIGAFARDYCDLGTGLSVGKATLFYAWKTWCKDQGRDHPGTEATFGRDLLSWAPGLKAERRGAGEDRYRVYEGIQIKQEIKDEWAKAKQNPYDYS